MNIVKVAAHACIRVQKMALPLIERGHNVHLIADKVPSYVESYTTFTKTHDLGQLIEAIKLYSNIADVFHAHNEPSWYVTIIKEHTDVPVVLDVHDSYLARSTSEEWEEMMSKGEQHIRITHEERNNFQNADALVFPGDGFRDLVTKEFGLPQPAITLPSYLPKRMFRYDCRERLGGIVYEGKVNTTKEIESSPMLRGFNYCDYEKLAKKMQELGIDFHLYTIRKDKEYLETYPDIAFTHEPMNYEKLMTNLTRHDWGLVGNIDPTPEWDVAMPNKLFEYLAACVPVVAINAKECGEFVRKHGVGIEVKSLEELRDRWSEHRECRANLIKVRQKFTMENNIGELERLYRLVTKTKNQKVRDIVNG